MWGVLLFLTAFIITACEERGPIIVGKLEQVSSCQYPIRENWTSLCVSIEAVDRKYYRKGDRFDVRLTVRNEGDAVLEDVAGHLQSFLFMERVVEFGDVAPGEEANVQLRLQAARDEHWNNILFFVSSNEPCDFRAHVIFPPIEDPKRVGMCAEVFQEVQPKRG